MKTESLKSLGLTDEQIKSVMAENGKDIEAEKAKTKAANDALEAEKTAKATLEQKVTDLEGKKEFEEWKRQQGLKKRQKPIKTE